MRWALPVVLTVCLLGYVAPLVAQEANPAAGHDSETSGGLLLRAESLMVLPRSQPVLHVRVANATAEPFAGQVSVQVPSSWRLAASSQDVQLSAGETRRLAFSVAAANDDPANCYEVTVRAAGEGKQAERRQGIVVASAPYFKPTIDGDPSDWKDAIPISWSVAGRRTTVATTWNRRQFSLLISVEETMHVRLGNSPCFDAVQLALAAQDTVTSCDRDDAADRFEYLICADQQNGGSAYQLASPGLKLADTCQPRTLAPLLNKEVEVAVRRDANVTHYEIGLPVSEIRPQIKPSEGREFFLSLLIHDPDGTGIRDWGEAAGLWESQRNRLAWSDWEGAQWGDKPPMDCRVEWGMCSSKY